MDLPTATILSGEDAKGFKNREHKEKYVTIAKDRSVRYSIRIRSIKDNLASLDHSQ